MRLIAVGLLVLAQAAPAAAATPSLDGIWRTDGYGEILSVHAGRLEVFQTTDVSCLPAQHGHAVSTHGAATRFAVPGDDAVTLTVQSAGTLREHVDSAVSTRLLRRLPALPGACTRPVPADPRSVFDVFWASFAENYRFFALHGVDWGALRAHYRPQVTAHTSSARLFAIFRAMLAPLHDEHVLLATADGKYFARPRPGTRIPTPQLDAQVRALTVRTDLARLGVDGLTDYADGRVSYAELPGGIGYLRVSGYTAADTEPANRAALDHALAAICTADHVRSWRGLMVDLRVNGGGSDALALRLTRHLVGAREFAYAKRYWTGAAWSAPQRIAVDPAHTSFAGPLALLVSGSTVSAGETFTQSLLARRTAPILVGRPTQGVFSDTLDRLLPNGWLVTLPNEQYRTQTGDSFDGRGIPPTVARPFTTTGPEDPIFATAYRLIRTTRAAPLRRGSATASR